MLSLFISLTQTSFISSLDLVVACEGKISKVFPIQQACMFRLLKFLQTSELITTNNINKKHTHTHNSSKPILINLFNYQK